MDVLVQAPFPLGDGRTVYIYIYIYTHTYIYIYIYSPNSVYTMGFSRVIRLVTVLLLTRANLKRWFYSMLETKLAVAAAP